MYEATINTHYQNFHIKEKTLRNKCDICQILVKDVIEHKKNIHTRCVSCRQYFLSLSILRKHELECASLEVVELDEKRYYFHLKFRLKYQSEQDRNDQITKSRLWDDCFSSHRNQNLFFYLHSFCSDGKANLSKAWSTIGNISPDDKFDPNEKKAAIMCVLNYELIEKIIKKIEKLIIIANLAENHAVLVLQAYFSNKLQDSVCSYLRKDLFYSLK